MKSPWGVFVMAVIPCALLLIIDLLRVRAAERPLPEVVPQVKGSEEPSPAAPQISVDENGSAAFHRNRSRSVSADSILFTYNSSPKKKPDPSAPTMSDKDVLSLLNAPSTRAVSENKESAKPVEKPAAEKKKSGRQTL